MKYNIQLKPHQQAGNPPTRWYTHLQVSNRLVALTILSALEIEAESNPKLRARIVDSTGQVLRDTKDVENYPPLAPLAFRT